MTLIDLLDALTKYSGPTLIIGFLLIVIKVQDARIEKLRDKLDGVGLKSAMAIENNNTVLSSLTDIIKDRRS